MGRRAGGVEPNLETRGSEIYARQVVRHDGDGSFFAFARRSVDDLNHMPA